MIIGAGLDKTGLMTRVAATLLKLAGRTEARIIPAVSGPVGLISSFMQNVGAAALFLPVVGRIAARTGIPLSRLLMPMGFSAILGGTITLVGSSPLILLNDLILSSNKALPANSQMATWSLFSVTPIRLALLATGMVYFVLAGRFVLPRRPHEEITRATGTLEYFQALYGLDYALREVQVPAGAPCLARRWTRWNGLGACGSSPCNPVAIRRVSGPAAWHATSASRPGWSWVSWARRIRSAPSRRRTA